MQHFRTIQQTLLGFGQKGGGAGLYGRRSTVIWQEERGYMAGGARYMMEERCYIAGRMQLYLCNENSGLPKLLLWSHALCSDQLINFIAI